MMKLFATVLAMAGAASAMAQSSVGLSLGINAPGMYGQITIGTPPAPALVSPRPLIVAPVPVGAPPAYLYVPVAQQHDWRGYCRKYDACSRPVYFVREDRVRDRYAHEHPGRSRRPPHVRAASDKGRRDHERHD